MVQIPFINIVGSLLLLIVPTVIGMVVRHYHPKVVAKCRKIIKVVTAFVIIFAMVFGLYANVYLLRLITWCTLIAGMLLSYSGYIMGYLISWFLRQAHKDCRTIAIETGIQNAGQLIHS